MTDKAKPQTTKTNNKPHTQLPATSSSVSYYLKGKGEKGRRQITVLALRSAAAGVLRFQTQPLE